MIEIVRPLPQSSIALILFLVIILIYAVLYTDDPKRFRYFLTSVFNKQYDVNYRRQTKPFEYFVILFSLASFLSASFILSGYLEYCSSYTDYSSLYFSSAIFIVVFLSLKWGLIYMTSFLLRQQTLFYELVSLSIHYLNLFFIPVVLSSIYFYLINAFALKQILLLFSTTFILFFLSKVKVFIDLRKRRSFEISYIILYICLFEIAPLLWLLIALKC